MGTFCVGMVSDSIKGLYGRTVRQRFKGGGDAVLFDDVRPNGDAVGVSPDDGVRVLDGAVILGVFWTDHNIVCLERGQGVSYLR